MIRVRKRAAFSGTGLGAGRRPDRLDPRLAGKNAGTVATTPKRVLIVDDQPHVLGVLRELIASYKHEHPYEITTTQVVTDALSMLERERFDLILLDMVMPGIGDPMLRRQGLDVLKLIVDRGVTAPVIMMSGDRDNRKVADALSQGAFAYLHKPFDLSELERSVARALATSG
jgi:DNA-binding NtrC family response regulator